MTRLDFLFRSTLFFLVTSFTQAKATRCTNCEDPGGDPGGDDGGDGTTQTSPPIRGPAPEFPTCFPTPKQFDALRIGGWETCTYVWYGTAPFCDGSCDSAPFGAVEVARSDNPSFCPWDTETERVDGNQCSGCGGRTCTLGTKVLCKQDCVGTIVQA